MFEILQNGGFSMNKSAKGRKITILIGLVIAVMLSFLVHGSRKEERKKYYMATESNLVVSDLDVKGEIQESPGHMEQIDTKVNAIKHYLTKEVEVEGVDAISIQDAAVKIEFHIHSNLPEGDIPQGKLVVIASNEMQSIYEDTPESSEYSEFYMVQKIGEVTAVQGVDFDGTTVKDEQLEKIAFPYGYYTVIESPDKKWRKLAVLSKEDFKKAEKGSRIIPDSTQPKKYKLGE